MTIHTLSSVTKDISKIDMPLLTDILNTLRRKSRLINLGPNELPSITIRSWTYTEIIDNILSGKKVPRGRTFANTAIRTDRQQIHIIVPPIEINEKGRFIFTLIHELVHGFSSGISGHAIPGPLLDLNEGLTDIIAMRIYTEYCYRAGIPRQTFKICYDTEVKKIMETIQELEKRGYGDFNLILDAFIQGYFSGINIVDTIKTLITESGTDIDDLVFITKQLVSP